MSASRIRAARSGRCTASMSLSFESPPFDVSLSTAPPPRTISMDSRDTEPDFATKLGWSMRGFLFFMGSRWLV